MKIFAQNDIREQGYKVLLCILLGITNNEFQYFNAQEISIYMILITKREGAAGKS